MRALDNYLNKHRWRHAWRQIVRLLEAGTLDVTQYDDWGQYAGRIEAGLARQWIAREKFWRDLSRAVTRAENQKGVQTHKGLIYFKIGAMALFNGRKYQTVVQWLQRAYEEDERLWEQRHQRLPQEESAYKLLHIIRAFGVNPINWTAKPGKFEHCGG